MLICIGYYSSFEYLEDLFWMAALCHPELYVGAPLLSVRLLFPISYSVAVTFRYSSDVDRGTCMYIGTHCEREDPYGFLSAHCILGTSIYIRFPLRSLCPSFVQFMSQPASALAFLPSPSFPPSPSSRNRCPLCPNRALHPSLASSCSSRAIIPWSGRCA